MEFGTASSSGGRSRSRSALPAEVAARPAGLRMSRRRSAADCRIVREVTVGSPVSGARNWRGLLPPPSDPAELPQLQQLRAEAVSALEFATRDRERAERLSDAGAAPAKAARGGAGGRTQARARLTAADARSHSTTPRRSGRRRVVKRAFQCPRAGDRQIAASAKQRPVRTSPPALSCFALVRYLTGTFGWSSAGSRRGPSRSAPAAPRIEVPGESATHSRRQRWRASAGSSIRRRERCR